MVRRAVRLDDWRQNRALPSGYKKPVHVVGVRLLRARRALERPQGSASLRAAHVHGPARYPFWQSGHDAGARWQVPFCSWPVERSPGDGCMVACETDVARWFAHECAPEWYSEATGDLLRGRVQKGCWWDCRHQVEMRHRVWTFPSTIGPVGPCRTPVGRRYVTFDGGLRWLRLGTGNTLDPLERRNRAAVQVEGVERVTMALTAFAEGGLEALVSFATGPEGSIAAAGLAAGLTGPVCGPLDGPASTLQGER